MKPSHFTKRTLAVLSSLMFLLVFTSACSSTDDHSTTSPTGTTDLSTTITSDIPTTESNDLPLITNKASETSVVIPDGTKEITDRTFQGSKSLVMASVPASVTQIQDLAFDDCPNLHSVYFQGDAPETADNAFTPAPYLTLYYPEGARGWTNPWKGCTTAPYPASEFAAHADADALAVSESAYKEALEAYEGFLAGEIGAEDPNHERTENNAFYLEDLFPDENSLQTLFDMNGDGIPELHLWHTGIGGYEILTYRDHQIVLWHADTSYCTLLDNGALLYERLGGAPTHTNYMYILLDANGDEAACVNFATYDIVDANGSKTGTQYLYEDTEVSEARWQALTESFFSIKSDSIDWQPL